MAIELPEGAAKAGHRADGARSALPSAVRIGFSRVVPEIKMFYRRPEQLALTFSMPAVICLLLGSTTPLTHQQLSTLYPSSSDYLAKYAAATDAQITAGFLLPEDRDQIIKGEDPTRITAS